MTSDVVDSESYDRKKLDPKDFLEHFILISSNYSNILTGS